jgi:hypothetical protein
MPSTRFAPRFAAFTLIAAALTLGAGISFADANGRTGRAQSSSGCGGCHGSQSTAVTVSITGPQSVQVGSTNSYTVTVSGGPASTAGGFNLKASGGTLAAGINNSVSGTEVTHTSPSSRSWTFSWTAPSTAGAQNFWAVALAADNGGDESGDKWNWYGGALNTAFPITVSAAAGVESGLSRTWLAPPWPNPCSGSTRMAYSLANPGRVRLELLDTQGRRVAMLADGVVPAGRQDFVWAARNSTGGRVPPGTYFLKLTAPDQQLTNRVTVVE